MSYNTILDLHSRLYLDDKEIRIVKINRQLGLAKIKLIDFNIELFVHVNVLRNKPINNKYLSINLMGGWSNDN